MRNKWLVLPLSAVLVFGMSVAPFADQNPNGKMNTAQKHFSNYKNFSNDKNDPKGFKDYKKFKDFKGIKDFKQFSFNDHGNENRVQATGIAASILKYNNVKHYYGSGKMGGNFIADVASQTGRDGKFAGVAMNAPNQAYNNAIFAFLYNHPGMVKEIVCPVVVTNVGGVGIEDFGVMNGSKVLGYSVGFKLTNALAADIEKISITLYNNNTVLGTVMSDAVTANYPTATSLSAPFDVFGSFDYTADGNWKYSGWKVDGSVIPTKAVVTVTHKNGTVKTAFSENLTGDTALLVLHGSSVVAEDFGIINVSNVLGYTVGFGLVDATASDVEKITITLFSHDVPLAVVTSDGAQQNYPEATSLSAPFDVLGSFDYAADGNWKYSGWNASHTVIPTKAVITVVFKNGLVKTVLSQVLIGDTTPITQ